MTTFTYCAIKSHKLHHRLTDGKCESIRQSFRRRKMAPTSDVNEAVLALNIKYSKLQREIAVALRLPRQRRSCIRGSDNEDRKAWELVYHSFPDNGQVRLNARNESHDTVLLFGFCSGSICPKCLCDSPRICRAEGYGSFLAC